MEIVINSRQCGKSISLKKMRLRNAIDLLKRGAIDEATFVRWVRDIDPAMNPEKIKDSPP